MAKNYKGIGYCNTRMFSMHVRGNGVDVEKRQRRFIWSLIDRGAWPDEDTGEEEGFKVIATGDSEWIGELHGDIARLMRHAYRRGYDAALETVREESESKAS